jgi:7-cyano-7-deazaguanine synthase
MMTNHITRKIAYTILSGGIDSTLATIIAKEKYKTAKSIFFDYGQKARDMEWKAANSICSALGIEKPENVKIDLHWDESYLTKEKDNKKFIMHGRNLIFIALALSFVRTKGGGVIITGFNKSDAGFDTSEKFVAMISNILENENNDASSEGKRVTLVSPLIELEKVQIINEFKNRKMEDILKLTYSCYAGTEPPCGVCHACKNRSEALNKVYSP